MTVRAQYTAGRRRAARRSPGYLEEDGVPGRLAHRDLRGAAARGPQLALGGRADLPAHRQAARAQGHRDRGPAQAGAAPGVPVARARSACSPTSSSSPCSPTRACRCRWARRSPARSMRIRPVNMEFLYGTRVHVAVAGGLRAADPRRDARRRDAVHAQRRGRSRSGRSSTRSCKAWHDGDAGRCRPTRPARPGPAEADELIGAAALARALSAMTDDVWRERDTTPGAIEAALRELLAERHQEERAFVPARVMNLVVIVDREFRGEIENRLERVGRYHPSRLVLVRGRAEGRTTLDAWARSATDDAEPGRATSRSARERVELDDRRRSTCAKLDTIVDPLLVSDLATMVWAPHGHAEAVDALRRLAQIVLIDSQDEPDVDARARARRRPRRATPTWSTSRGCARRRGASASRPRSTRRALRARAAARSPASPCATARTRSRAGAAVLRLAGLAAGLAARSALAHARRRAAPATRARAAQDIKIDARAGRHERARAGAA